MQSPLRISLRSRPASLLSAPVLSQRRSLSSSPSSLPELSESFPTPSASSEILSTLASPGASTLLEPFSSVLLTLPPSLSLSYALFLPLFTLLLRTSTTLPLTLWQRARTRRFAEVVMPLVRVAQKKASLETRDAYRKAGKSYEEYQVAYKKRAKKDAASLASQHSASPLPTLLIPPLLHLPIFIGTTLILRDLCQRSLGSLSTYSPISSPSEPLSLLHEFASSPFLWCDSLILPDASMALPLLVGLASLGNIELSARTRQATARAVFEAEKVRLGREKDAARERERGVGKALSGRGMTNAVRKREMERNRVVVTGASGKEGKVGEEDEGPEEPRTARLITNALRGSAVAFIVIASMSPAAVCGYWLTSNLFTLVQNALFARVDRRREAQYKIMESNIGR